MKKETDDKALEEAWKIEGESWCSCMFNENRQVVCETHKQIADLLRPTQSELTRFTENVEYLLDNNGLAVRVCEGGGPEDIVQSMIVTFMKLEHEIDKLNSHDAPAEVQELRGKVRALEEEVERLKSGKLTAEEFNNLCHETDRPISLEHFAACCKEYQAKLYGEAAVEKLREKSFGAEKEKVRELYSKLCSFWLQLGKVHSDIDDYLNSEACDFAGKELAADKKS